MTISGDHSIVAQKMAAIANDESLPGEIPDRGVPPERINNHTHTESQEQQRQQQQPEQQQQSVDDSIQRRCQQSIDDSIQRKIQDGKQAALASVLAAKKQRTQEHDGNEGDGDETSPSRNTGMRATTTTTTTNNNNNNDDAPVLGRQANHVSPGAVTVSRGGQQQQANNQNDDRQRSEIMMDNRLPSTQIHVEATLVTRPVFAVATLQEEESETNVVMNGSSKAFVADLEHGGKGESSTTSSPTPAPRKRTPLCWFLLCLAFALVVGAVASVVTVLVVSKERSTGSESTDPLTPGAPTIATTTPATTAIATSSTTTTTTTATTAADTEAPEIPNPAARLVNTYCTGVYDEGGDGICGNGDRYRAVWTRCVLAGTDTCMGIMWNPCRGPNENKDRTVNGAWKLLTPGQTFGENSTTCRNDDVHWDVFVVEEPIFN